MKQIHMMLVFMILTSYSLLPIYAQSTVDEQVNDIRMMCQKINSELHLFEEKNVRWDAGASYWNSTNYTGYLDASKQVVMLKFSHGEEGYWGNYEYYFNNGEIGFIFIHSGEPDGTEKQESIYFWNKAIIRANIKQKPSDQTRSMDDLEEKTNDEIMNRVGESTQMFLTGVDTEIRNFREAMNQLPESVLLLLNKDSKVIAHAAADINGDTFDDYIVAIGLDPNDAEWKEVQDRKLFIIVRQGENYAVHSTSNLVLLCSTCGGTFGDPFSGIQTGNKWFAISHYGGSRGKWAFGYKFGYSKKYDKWQLIEVNEESFDSFNPEKSERATYKPPKDFGMINFEDFDPFDYRGKGVK
jgi:hypothetical protein